MIFLKRLARDSLVHFLTLGALVYGAFGLIKGELTEDSGRTITVTQREIKALIDWSIRAWNRPLPSQKTR